MIRTIFNKRDGIYPKKYASHLILSISFLCTLLFSVSSCKNEEIDPITEGCIKVEIKGISNGIVEALAIDSDLVWQIRFNESDLNGLPVIVEDIIEIHIISYQTDALQFDVSSVPSITCDKVSYCQ